MNIPSELSSEVTKPDSVTVEEILVNLEQQAQDYEVALECPSSLPNCTNVKVLPTSGTVGTLKNLYIYISFNSSGIAATSYLFHLNITTKYELGDSTDDSRIWRINHVRVPYTVTVTAVAELQTTETVMSPNGPPILGDTYFAYVFPHDSDGFPITEDTQEDFSMELYSSANVTTTSRRLSLEPAAEANCETAWLACPASAGDDCTAYLKYELICRMPTVDYAGVWKYTIKLRGVTFERGELIALCPISEYADSTDMCKTCPAGVDCSKAGVTLATFELQDGWWRSGPNSDTVIECPHASACSGFSNSTDSLCRSGYEGPLCAVCIEGWFESTETGNCEPCGETKSHTGTIVIGCLLTTVVLLLAVGLYWAYEERERVPVVAKLVHKCELAVEPVKVKGKIIVLTYQVMYAFAGIAHKYDGVVFPSPADNFVAKLGIFNLDVIGYVPAKCIKRDATFYTTLVIKTVGPLCVLSAVSLMCTSHMAFATRRLQQLHAGSSDPHQQIQERTRELRANYFFFVLVFLELTLPTTSMTIFASLVCEQFDDGSYLREQLTISCETANFRWWQSYALSFVFVYPIGVPCFFLSSLFVLRKRINPTLPKAVGGKRRSTLMKRVLESIKTRETDPALLAVKFLFEDFRPACYWFGTFNLVVRLLETSVLLFFDGKDVRVAFALIMVFISINFNRELMPYRTESDNVVAYLAQWILCLWFFTMNLIHLGVAQKMPTELLGGVLIVTALAVVLTAVPQIMAEVQQKEEQEAQQKRENEETDFDYRLNPLAPSNRIAIPARGSLGGADRSAHSAPSPPPPPPPPGTRSRTARPATPARASDFDFGDIVGFGGASIEMVEPEALNPQPGASAQPDAARQGSRQLVGTDKRSGKALWDSARTRLKAASSTFHQV